jgi:dCTP diphosphatase
MKSIDSLETLQERLNEFVAERDWEQFHYPKNVVMALAAEAGELLEHFMWLTPEESDKLSSETRAEVELEIADVLFFLIRLCDRLDIDLLQAAEKKLAINEQKYPVDKARGKATKYTKL